MTAEDLPRVVYYTHTAAADTQFRVTGAGSADIWLREANIHCVTNNALYGDFANQVVPFNTGDVISFQDFNLSDMWFKNATAGSNCVIYVVGIVMTKARRDELGI